MVTNPDARAVLYQQAIRQVEAELERVNAALAAMETADEGSDVTTRVSEPSREGATRPASVRDGILLKLPELRG
jgi:hypothetical protein